VAVAVLVVTCPCALSLATPAATLAAAGALARRGVLVRQLQALEAGAAVDTLVFDKTGTLTQDRMTVAAIRCREGLSPERALALAASLAAGSLHPASRAIADRAASEGTHDRGDMSAQPRTSGTDHIADHTANRFATPTADHLTEHPGQGVEGQVAGRSLRLGAAAFCRAPALPGPESDHPQVHLADESGWLASFDLEETLRPDARETLERLRAWGLDLHLLSGDRPSAVARLAERAGIATWRGSCTPEDKMAEVRALQQQGRKVAMVGDGMNDGPVLALADLSVAMGEGLPLAQARADVVVQGGRLMPVADLLALARRTQQVVRRNLAWAAFYNAAAVPLAVAGFMPAWLAGLGMAASSLVVVAYSATLARRLGLPGTSRPAVSLT
jgi:Cu2+-exporting ATPase